MKAIIQTLACTALILLSCSAFSQTEEQIIKNRIDNFYRSYITASAQMPLNFTTLDELKTEYCTANLITFLEQDELDYDIFLNAQEVMIEWLNTLSVTKESNLYVVSYYDSYKKANTIIKLNIIDENGKYKINSINLK
jgi:hypothetical protein